MIKMLTALLIIMLALSACGKRDYEISELTKAEEQKVTELGSKLAGAVMDTLRNALMAAMKEGGPMEAVKVCNTKALIITRLVADQSNMKIDIKRTSFNYRNPANKPEPVEEEALNYFSDKIASKSDLPVNYIQKVSDKNGLHYYFYKPIKVQSFCLPCHGDEKNLHPGMKPLLKNIYPTDKATGYKEGDFRGLIRVRFDGSI